MSELDVLREMSSRPTHSDAQADATNNREGPRPDISMADPEAIAALQDLANPADEIAGRFHHRLVAIHPFPNCSGRHARLMADLLAERLGCPSAMLVFQKF